MEKPKSNFNRVTITGEDIRANFISKPIVPHTDLYSQLERGVNRVRDGLLNTAIDRPLNDQEIHLMEVIYCVEKPTPEEAEYFKSQGIEE
jgi:hypothetical protein